MRVDHDHYIKSARRLTRVEGKTDPKWVNDREEIVDAAYVQRYLDARDFFEGLGGTETHTRLSGGRLRVSATDPEGRLTVETLFTPTTGPVEG